MTPATEYLVAYWNDLWDGVASKQGLLRSFNPRVAIRELLDEITLNDLSNKANIFFFKRIIDEYKRNDPGSLRGIKIDLGLILSEFDKYKHRPIYLEQLCKNVLNRFESLEYFDDCIEELLTLVNAESFSNSEKAKIQKIASHIVVEFREIGYVDDEIKYFLQKVFSQTRYVNNQLLWEYPHQLPRPRDWDDKDEVSAYHQRAEELNRTLTDDSRIRALRNIAAKKPENIRFIFKCAGIRGDHQLQINDVLFYPPAKVSLVGDNEESDVDEFLGRDRKMDPSVINASVVVNAVSHKSGEIIARAKVEKALDGLRHVIRGDQVLSISRSVLSISDESTYVSSQTFEKKEDDYTSLFMIESVRKSQIDDRADRISKVMRSAVQNGWDRQLTESMRWYRKGEEARSEAEQFLSYWISIESLCKDGTNSNWFEVKNDQIESDFSRIKEVVGKTRAIGMCYETGWVLFRDLDNDMRRKFRGIEIPLDILSRSGLGHKPDTKIHLLDFIIEAENIERCLSDGILRDQMNEMRRFYADKQYAADKLLQIKKSIDDELTFLYRMRNKIAHDGSTAHPLLPGLCKLIGGYAASFLWRVVDAADTKQARLDEHLVGFVQAYEKLEIRLKTENPTDVFLRNI